MVAGGWSSTLLPRAVIADRYQLLDKLGEGGMASVWVARHLALGVDVAVKFIDRRLVFSPEARARFAQEAKACATIRSPHVVTVLDYGAGQDEQPYIVMELLHGEDLGARLQRVGRLSLSDAARVLNHACKGLAKAHAAGIIHRDIKPENLFLCEEDDDDGFVVKLFDFGIAKADEFGLNKTVDGVLLGTPLYMSPEQARGQRVDLRSDLYSLATVLYHTLTGAPPFNHDSLMKLVAAITGAEPVPVRATRPELPPDIDAWFAKAMQKAPGDRFESAREMADAWSKAASTATDPCADGSSVELRMADGPGGSRPPMAITPSELQGPDPIAWQDGQLPSREPPESAMEASGASDIEESEACPPSEGDTTEVMFGVLADAEAAGGRGAGDRIAAPTEPAEPPSPARAPDADDGLAAAALAGAEQDEEEQGPDSLRTEVMHLDTALEEREPEQDALTTTLHDPRETYEQLEAVRALLAEAHARKRESSPSVEGGAELRPAEIPPDDSGQSGVVDSTAGSTSQPIETTVQANSDAASGETSPNDEAGEDTAEGAASADVAGEGEEGRAGPGEQPRTEAITAGGSLRWMVIAILLVGTAVALLWQLRAAG